MLQSPMRYIQKKMLKTCESENLIAHHFLSREEKIKRRRTLKQTKTTSHSLMLGDLKQRTSASTTSYFVKANNFIRYFEFFRPCRLSVRESKHLFFVCFLFFLITFGQFQRFPTGHITD